jgi:hypothetical protein
MTLSGVMVVGFLMGGSPATAAGPEMAAAQQVSVATTAPTSVSSAAASSSSDQQLPFDPPAASAHQKLVFAHYFTPYPISLDNKDPNSDYYAVNYLQPSGEGGKFASIGGLLRDRPIGQAPGSGDWKLANAMSEIRQAQNAGIDGWILNILNTSGTTWDTVVRTVDAADAVGNFKITLSVDMTAAVGSTDSGVIADKIVSLARRPSIYRIGSGDFVLGAFKAENKTIDWWRALLTDITNGSGLTVRFIPTVLDANANIEKFAPISYGIGNWGVRNPGTILAGPNYAARAHAVGLKWMAPVAIQDERPNQKMYDEAGNTETLRASWQRAIGDQADLVQLVTWNDYSEGTSFAPSDGHGYSFLGLNAYWQTQFQTGRPPGITRDAMYVTHRIQRFAASPSYPQQLMVLPAYKTGLAARDTVEVVTFLTDPAQITVRVGPNSYSYGAPAGPDARLYPLETGHITVTAQRYGNSIGVANSPYTVDATPYTQDLAYYAVTGRMVNTPQASDGGVAAARTGMGAFAFVRGTDDQVWFRSTDSGGAYTNLGGTIKYGPAAVSWAADRLDLFAVGSDGALYHRAGSASGQWNGWESLGGLLTSSPAALSFSPGTLNVYGRGGDGQLWTIAWTGSAWTPWSPLGGGLSSAPGGSVDRDSGQATVGVRGLDGKLYELRFGASGPGAYTAVGTSLNSAPAYASRLGDGNSTVLAYLNKNLAPSVGGITLGGIITSTPAVLADVTGRGVSVFGRGGDGALWMYRGAPGAGSWSSLGGQLT